MSKESWRNHSDDPLPLQQSQPPDAVPHSTKMGNFVGYLANSNIKTWPPLTGPQTALMRSREGTCEKVGVHV